MIPGLNSLIYAGSKSTGGFSASAQPPSSQANGSGTVTGGGAGCTPTGGTSPYTYQWLFDSGDPSISTTAPTSNTTAFTAVLSGGDSISAYFYCKVTDHVGNIALSNDVYILMQFVA